MSLIFIQWLKRAKTAIKKIKSFGWVAGPGMGEQFCCSRFVAWQMTRYVIDIHPGHGCIEMTSCSTSLSALSILFGNLVFVKSCTVVKESKDSDKKNQKLRLGGRAGHGGLKRAKTAIKKIKSFGWVAGPGMGEQFCCSRFVTWQMTRYVIDIHPGHGCIEMTSCSTSLSALSILFGNLVFVKSCTVVKESKDSDKKNQKLRLGGRAGHGTWMHRNDKLIHFTFCFVNFVRESCFCQILHSGHGCIEMTSCSTSLSALSLLFGNLVFDKSCTVVKESKESDKKSKASVGWQGRAW
ncbi:hypothetical protein BDC45DRAFT_555168, partial [Circinella umbellata]